MNDLHDYLPGLDLGSIDAILNTMEQHMKPAPVHEHDCERCTYIGRHVSDTGIVRDVYRSCDSNFKEYIMRFGSDGPDYMTVMDRSPLWNICQQIEGGH